MTSGQKRFFKENALTVVLFTDLVVFVFGYFVLPYFNYLYTPPNDHILINWDAAWYMSIRERGYRYDPISTF